MNKHISEQYEHELAYIRNLLMEMGGVVEQQLAAACTAFATHDSNAAEIVRDTESKVNQFEVELDDQCVSIIAKRQPTASDLRRVVSVMKVITDLERIGDEADRVAKMTSNLVGKPIPSHQYSDFRQMAAQVGKMLNRTLDAFARLDVESAIRVIQSDEEVDQTYHALIRKCTEDMRDHPDDIDSNVAIMWVARALERIGDHSKNISEYVIYQVKGYDIRHAPDLPEDS